MTWSISMISHWIPLMVCYWIIPWHRHTSITLQVSRVMISLPRTPKQHTLTTGLLPHPLGVIFVHHRTLRMEKLGVVSQDTQQNNVVIDVVLFKQKIQYHWFRFSNHSSPCSSSQQFSLINWKEFSQFSCWPFPKGFFSLKGKTLLAL